jgi:uncharacterized RDD family membrane protein YckC/Tfp pilus assembly major pilin PilA
MDENSASRGRPLLPDHLRAPTLHAGFWRRVAAYIIDWFITVPGLLAIEFIWVFPQVFAGANGSDAPFPVGRFLLFYLLAIVITWLYFAICEASKWQATPGKLAMGLRVTDEYGRRIGFGRATGRFFGKFVSGLIMDVGYMMAGFTARKQGLHDMMAGCCVVRKDALAMFERDALPTASDVRSTGMPGWAIALIIVAAGFFLVIPVIAIMAAIAIPAYQNYLVRAQVAEGVTLSYTARDAVTQYIASHGSMPEDNAAAGMSSPGQITGQYVSSVAVHDGQVVVTFGDSAESQIRGEHLIMVPQGDLSALHWQCRSPDIEVKFLPQSCRE